MSKSDKPNLDAQIIPKDDYIPELEEQVAFWVRNTPDDPWNDKFIYKEVGY
jgi:hypothetical protein